MLRYVYCVLFLGLLGCKQEPLKNETFQKISSEYSGLTFRNDIKENTILNILDYEYLYNGGGVGIGDFNMDGLPDICVSGNMVPSRIYINKGNLRFQDITESSGFITDSWCTGVSVVDINNDGKPDIHIATAHDLSLNATENYFFINESDINGNVKFRNVARDMNISDLSYTMQAVWLDYDRDGDLDLFLANNSKEEYPKNNAFGQRKDGKGRSTDRLYRNMGIGENGIPLFENVSKEAGINIEGWSLGVVVTDINNDQYPDIYVANDFLSNDLLYINNQDGTFSNKIEEFFSHQSHNSMGVDVGDINNDQKPDFLVLDMLPENNLRKKTMFSDIPFDRFKSSLKSGYQPQYVRNVLQISDQSGYSDISNFAGVSATDWSWTPLIADFDNDGLRDIYITNGYKKDITDMDFVDFTNSSNTFGSYEQKRAALVAQLEKMKGIKKSNFYFKNQGHGKFKDETLGSGLDKPSYSNGGVYVDLDLDGDLDLVVNNIDDEIFLLENKVTSLNEDRNFFRIKFEPDAKSLGTKVWLFANDDTFFGEFNSQRGYLSSVEPFLHFGLGNTNKIDSIRILWPDNKITKLQDLNANQTILPQKGDDVLINKKNNKEEVAFLKEIESPLNTPYRHAENSFDDFKKWPLHFRGHSKPGPVLIGGDINQDGLEDFLVGGTANNPANFYVQNGDGKFVLRSFQSHRDEMAPESSGGCLFDMDNDGDLDLYLANGSSEYYHETEKYQDFLYINDGLGNFQRSIEGLPNISFPTNTVIPLDFDRDGDLDLFVGGRLDPNNYPFSPRSYILENNNGTFSDVTKIVSPDLEFPGMISGAIAEDINKDGWVDLITVGEWNPVKVFLNIDGSFNEDRSDNDLSKTHGWWNCIQGGDFDGDGDIDFVAGNWGLNNPFRASQKEPLTLYAMDFDNNGSIEPIMTYFNEKREYIFQTRGTLIKQLPGVRKLANTYADYGSSTFQELFDKSKIDDKTIFKTYELASMYFENNGNGSFTGFALPDKVQWSPVFDFIDFDIDKDEVKELLAVGNYMDTEVLTGHYDAGKGNIMTHNRNKGIFELLKSDNTGFYVPEEARSIIKLKTKFQNDLIVIGLQNDSLRFFTRNKSNKNERIVP